MEKDPEIKGEGNSYTTEFRQYDPRLGRFMTPDPVIHPWQSPYCAMNNNPVLYNDPDGRTGIVTIDQNTRTMTISSHLTLYGNFENLETFTVDAQKITASLQNQLNLEAKTIIVNGEVYNIVWDLGVTVAEYGPNGTEASAFGGAEQIRDLLMNNSNSIHNPASENYARVVTSNLEQARIVTQDHKDQMNRVPNAGFIYNDFGHKGEQGLVSQWLKYGGNSGVLIHNDLITDPSAIIHEWLGHGFGLSHYDENGNMLLTKPDIKTAPGENASVFPKMDPKYVDQNGDLKVVNNRNFTQDNLLEALKKSGFDMNSNGTGINVIFNNGLFTKNIGKQDNKYVDGNGKEYDPGIRTGSDSNK